MKKYAWLLGFLYAPYSVAGEVQLQIDGCVAGQTVRVGLYTPTQDFPKLGELQRQDVVATAETIHVKFADVAAGRYAVAAYLDGNNNQKLDRNWLGAPSEPYGFSNHARNTFSAPSFEQAAFAVGATPMLQSIHLH
ncbi:MAG: DUF2141 domain-containing protein [Gallionella sp.]|nr:DUF2141 domain-containing protein [Gallionella sp.]MDD4960433.1 DUF2141 domain-containing protein [Gallionella sp.]